MPSTPSPRASNAIFELQPLETRRFLTTASVASGVLNITGTASNETIAVNRLSSGQVSITGVTTRYTPGTGSGQFTRINVMANGGNDIITISGNVPYTSATLAGANGNDSITGGGNADLIRGDAGFDTANYSARTTAVKVSLDGIANDGASAGLEGDNVQTEEVITGAGNDTLTGGAGADFLAGGGGHDLITANSGNDELIGATGADSMWGNSGDDALYAKNNDADIVNGGSNSDGSADFDLAAVDSLLDKATGSVSGLGMAMQAVLPANFEFSGPTFIPSQLDANFGVGGKAFDPPTQWAAVTAAAVDSYDRTILVGHRNGDFVATRYTADGRLDQGFGYGGEVLIDFDSDSSGYGSEDLALSVAVDANDNVYVAGSTTPSAADFAVAKLDANGELVHSFGTGGLAVYSIPNSNERAYDVVVQADGRVVVVGAVESSIDKQLAVARFTASGAPEGYVTVDLGWSEAYGVGLQTFAADGGKQRIVVAGRSDSGKALIRFNADMTRDSTFAETVTDGSSVEERYVDLAIGAANEIATVGYVGAGIGTGGIVAKHAADGTQLASTVETGVTSYAGVAVDRAGRVIASGERHGSVMIGRYDGATLAFDQSFAASPVETDFTPEGSDRFYGMSVDVFVLPGGRIVSAAEVNRGAAAARFYGDATVSEEPPTEEPTFEAEMEQAEVEDTFSYEDMQSANPPPELAVHFENLTPSALQYVLAQPDDENRAVIDLGIRSRSSSAMLAAVRSTSTSTSTVTPAPATVKISKIANEDGLEQIAVEVNGVVMYYDLDTAQLTINGTQWNDSILVASNVSVPLVINGGGGNDLITGGAGNDLIDGGDGTDLVSGAGGNDVILGTGGNDVMLGDAGRDILIGGAGKDWLTGGTGEDIVIGGTTGYDAMPDALRALSAEWSSGNARTTRITNLRVGGGLNDSTVLVRGTTVFEDSAVDSLGGGADVDWFFRRASGSYKDKMLDLASGEVVDSF